MKARLGKCFTCLAFCPCFINVFNSATIKIPLHKLRRDRLDKSPTQIAIEAELARKKEMDLPYEDCTEVMSKLSSLYSKP